MVNPKPPFPFCPSNNQMWHGLLCQKMEEKWLRRCKIAPNDPPFQEEVFCAVVKKGFSFRPLGGIFAQV